MIKLTLAELFLCLSKMTDEELKQNLTVRVSGDEFMQVSGIGVSKPGDVADGILDAGELYLNLNH